MKLFWNALHTTLVADATLVSLVEYSASNFSITHSEPKVREKVPGLYYYGDSDNFVVSVVESTLVTFECWGEKYNDSADVSKRVKDLLAQEGEEEYERYLNITDLNIRNIWTEYRDMRDAEYSAVSKGYFSTVRATFVWHYK